MKKFGDGIKDVENKTKSMSQKASSAFDSIGSDLTKLGANLTKFVTVPVTGLSAATLKTAVDFVKLKESSMGVFKQMLGGADAADKMYDSLLSIAKASTYSQEAFLTAGKTLVGMGTNAQDTAKYLQAITNAVAGFGGSSADIESLATVFGKVSAKGKVLTDDLNMIAERGVNGLQILAAHYKVTTDEMQDMVSDGMVPAKEGLDILCNGMENGYTYAGQFHQGMTGMAQSLKNGTLTGALDSLKSSFRNMSVQMWDAFANKPEMIEAINAIGNAMGKLPEIMGPITSAIGPMFQDFADKLNNITILAEKHPKLFENIVQAILKLAIAAPVIVSIGNGFKFLSSTIKTIDKTVKTFKTVTKAIKEFQLMTKLATVATKAQTVATKLATGAMKLFGLVMNANPLFLIVTAIVAVVAGLVLMYNKFEWFRNAVNGVFSFVIGIVNGVIDFFKNNWQTILLFILNPFAGIFKILYDKFEGFRNFVDGIISGIVGFFKNLWSNICSIFSSIVSFVSGVVNNIINFLAVPFDYVKNAFIFIVAITAMALEGIYNAIMWLINGAISILSTIANWIYTNVLQPVFNFFLSIFNSVYNVISSFISTVFSVFGTVANWIYTNVLLPVFNFYSSVFNAIYNGIVNFINSFISVFSTIASWIYTNVLMPIFNFFSNVWNGIVNITTTVVSKIRSAFNSIATFVKSVFNNVKSFISNIFSTIGGVIKAPINGVISAINTVLKSMNKIKVPDWVPGMGGKGVNFKMIPKLSVGTNYVAQEGLAYLHQGEAVVPKKYNPAIGGYGNSNQIVYVNVEANMDVNKFGKAFVRDVKTFSGGSKNSYNYGGSQ